MEAAASCVCSHLEEATDALNKLKEIRKVSMGVLLYFHLYILYISVVPKVWSEDPQGYLREFQGVPS